MIVNETKKDNGMISQLIKLIMTTSTKVINSKIKNMPKEWVGIISATTPSVSPNSYADVYLNGDLTSDVISIKNKTWETLTSDQNVMLHSPTGSLGNCIILYAK